MTLRELLDRMVHEEATNLYLTVGAPPVLDSGRELVPLGTAPLTSSEIEELTEGVLDDPTRETFAERLDVDVGYSVPDVGRFRVHLYHQRGTIAIVVHWIQTQVPRLETLHLPEVIQELALAPMGLVLVTGPADSGTSTTLAAMIDYRSQHRHGHIITIEDPIEFLHSHQRSLVSQREIGIDTPSYADALESALRQAPDVLVIGEIRDRETMAAALTVVETGHLVLGILHANHAHQALQRILSLFPVEAHPMVRLQLSQHLKAVLSQRLVARADGEGRVPAVEVLLSTMRVRDLIHKGDVEAVRSAMAVGIHEGMQTLDQALYALYRKGMITMATALDAAEDPSDLRLQIISGKARGGASGIRFAEESVPPRPEEGDGVPTYRLPSRDAPKKGVPLFRTQRDSGAPPS